MVKQFRTVAKGSKKPGLAAPLGVGAATGNVAGVVVGGGIGVVSEVKGVIASRAASSAKKISKVLDGFFMRQGWRSARAR